MITSVYGRCDEYDVIFKESGGKWRCCVPPDWTDGQYACEFYAQTDAGVIGYWTGILYISCGNLCPHLEDDLFTVWMMPDAPASLECDRLKPVLIRRNHDATDNATA